jgi:hypothetical protein
VSGCPLLLGLGDHGYWLPNGREADGGYGLLTARSGHMYIFPKDVEFSIAPCSSKLRGATEDFRKVVVHPLVTYQKIKPDFV